jgi:hypothetical protein
MPNPHQDTQEKLRKLGERIREGWAIENPISEQQLEIVRTTIRQQQEKERQEMSQGRDRSDPSKEPTKDASEPDLER